MDTKVCSKCKEEKPVENFRKSQSGKDGLRSGCNDCHIEYMRIYNASEEHREYNRQNMREYHKTHKYIRKTGEKRVAEQTVCHSVENGKIEKPCTCSMCNQTFEKQRIHGHHADYSKPLDVVWVCGMCHGKIHQEINDKKRELLLTRIEKYAKKKHLTRPDALAELVLKRLDEKEVTK